MTGGAGERQAPPGRRFLAVSYAVLLVGGAVLAVFGAFLLPYSASSGTSATIPTGGGASGSGHLLAAGGGGGLGQLLSVGLLVALVANPALSLAGLWMAGTRLAAFTPIAGWLLVALPMASTTSDGDLVLSNDLRSVAFLLLGALSFVAVGVLARPTRGATAVIGESLLGVGKAPPASRPVAVAPVRRKPAGRRTAPKGGRRR